MYIGLLLLNGRGDGHCLVHSSVHHRGVADHDGLGVADDDGVVCSAVGEGEREAEKEESEAGEELHAGE